MISPSKKIIDELALNWIIDELDYLNKEEVTKDL
jgi:hypothetical protein